METFRIEVGHVHQVKPGNIVGAIANETGIDTSYIGRIQIFEDHSTVDLAAGMPDDIFFALKKVWVAGQQLNISRVEWDSNSSGEPNRRRARDRSKSRRFTTRS